MDITQYIKPEMFVLVPVLWVIGSFIKESKILDWVIPFVLGGTGIFLSILWAVSTGSKLNFEAVLGEIFIGITQGILCAAAAVYADQLVKQTQVGQACKLCENLKKENIKVDGK
jgi:1,4-dihydroxy-2-naphthoate octaprenyltransferase